MLCLQGGQTAKLAVHSYILAYYKLYALCLIDLIIHLHRYDIYEDIKEGMSQTGFSKYNVHRAAVVELNSR